MQRRFIRIVKGQVVLVLHEDLIALIETGNRRPIAAFRQLPLDLADHPAVGTLFDPCNYYRHGGDPPAALKKLGKRVFYCHLKDASFPYPAHQPDSLPLAHSGQMQPWWWIRPLGQGNVEWRPILSELATFYTGYICLEHDIRDNVMWGTRTGIAYIKRLAADHDLNIEI